MLFSDGNVWHYPDKSVAAYRAERDFYEHRCVTQAGQVDAQFQAMRKAMAGLGGLLWYLFPNNTTSATYQADHLADVLGSLAHNEMVMLDIEAASKISDSQGFVSTWCQRVESRLHTLAWVYNPKSINLPRSVTGPRILKSPRYSGSASRGAAPDWAYDVHQFSDRAYFPGASEPGDANYTDWTTAALVDHCNGAGPAEPGPGPVDTGAAAQRRQQTLLLV